MKSTFIGSYSNARSYMIPQLVKPLFAPTENLDSGFHPFGVGKMINSKYVVG